MRSAFCALVVLVLLAPLGGVGITPTPHDAEILAAPRSLASSVAKPRVECELPSIAVCEPVPSLADRVDVLVTLVDSPSSPVVSDRHPPAGPRDPPV